MANRIFALMFFACLVQLTIALPLHAAATELHGVQALLQLDRLPYLKLDTLAGGQSSYDRNGGNNDYGNRLYDANGEQILLDLQGPGVVNRMWFTGFIPTDGAGHWVGVVASFAGVGTLFMEGDERIYIDDSQTPAIIRIIAGATTIF